MNDVRGTRDFDEEGFHEIQLSGKQLVFLCMATTVVSIVIFLCGVLVGRGVRPVETIAEAASPTAPADTPVVEPARSPRAAPPAVPPAVPDGAADLKPAARATAAPATPPVPAPVPAPKASDAPKNEPPKTAPAPANRVAPTKSAAASAAPSAHADVAPSAPAPSAGAASAPASKPAVGGTIAVQVGALRGKADAEALARRLSGKGYATYIVAPEAGAANQVFKVRVGNYASQDEAERVKRRLQQEEKLQPWITH